MLCRDHFLGLVDVAWLLAGLPWDVLLVVIEEGIDNVEIWLERVIDV